MHRTSLIAATLVLVGLASAAPVHAAAVTGDVFVDLFPVGGQADLTVIEAGTLAADPIGAATLTLTASFGTTGSLPSLLAGEFAIGDVGGGDYLRGTAISVDFDLDPIGEDRFTFRLQPTGGSALSTYRPFVIATIVGEFGVSVDSAFANGVAFVDGRIELSQVPEPTTLPLLFESLGVLSAMRWRRRNKASR